MKKIAFIMSLLFLLMSANSLYAGLCTTGQHVGNPHCRHHSSQSGTSSVGTSTGLGSAGQAPNPATENSHTGSVTPDHHNAQLVSGTSGPGTSGQSAVPPTPTPTPQATPTPVPHQVPPKVPMAKPHMVPNQVVTGTYAPGPSGYAAVPPTPTPTPQATPTPVPHQVPPKVPMAKPHMVPNQVGKGNSGSVPSGPLLKPTTPPMLSPSQPSHHLVISNNHLEKPATSGRYAAQTAYNFNVIEPGIQNKEVAVYRSNDVREMLYKDTIIMDQTGFSLIDIGIRDPDYIK